MSALPPHFSPSWPALCALVLHLPLAYPWPPAEQGAAACASLVQRVSMRANALQMRQNACQMRSAGHGASYVHSIMRILFVELTSSQYLNICGHPHAFHAHSCAFMRIPCAFHAHPDANPACSRIPWHPCASRHISCGLIRIHAHPMCSHASTCILMGPHASTHIMCSLCVFIRISAHSCALHTHQHAF